MSGPVLEVLSGDLAGRAYQVDEAEFVIGRAPNCHLVLPKRYISREHARILRDSGDQFVVDSLSHKNPVRVGDRPVREHVLTDGDEFEMCGIRFRFRRSGAAQQRRHAAVMMSSSRPSQPDARHDAPTPDPDEPSFGGGHADEPEDSLDARRSARDLDPPTPDPDAPAPGPARRSAAAEKKVVFDVEDSRESEDEQTAALPPPSSSKRSGEDARERTAELGKVGDPDDPDYDPFAEVGPSKVKKTGADPARERLMRVLTWVGLAAILGSAGVYYKITRPEEWKVQVLDTPQVLRLDEAITFVIPWTPDDPPSNRGSTLLSAEPEPFFSDSVVTVEWLCPHVDARSTFLVTAKDAGSTRMELEFQKSRRKLYVDIVVEGESLHEKGRQVRRDRLMKEHPDVSSLQDLALHHTKIGDGFKAERSVPGKEENYRRALIEYALAKDCVEAARLLLTKQGQVTGPELTRMIGECDEREKTARADYDEFVTRQIALYRLSLNQNDFLARSSALKRALLAISHECDPNYVRLATLQREWLKSPVDGTTLAKCDLR